MKITYDLWIHDGESISMPYKFAEGLESIKDCRELWQKIPANLHTIHNHFYVTITETGVPVYIGNFVTDEC